MARAAIGWTIRDLAREAGIGVATATRFENGRVDADPATVTAIRATLEEAGVEFIPGNGGGPGVRLRKAGVGGHEG
jgi:transcriptional regulator with XRE-family HTH domain